MVFMAFVIVPLTAIIAAWLTKSIISLGYFICNFLLGLLVLMWFILTLVGQIVHNCWWQIASVANSLVAYVWSYVRLPIDVIIHIIKHFGLLSLNLMHLVLRILYYVFLLWVFVYLLMLLYRFITHWDWASQIEFYVGDNLRGGKGCTLTIVPVLLNQNRRPCLNPPHII